jgi:hypothetical protein
MPMQKVAKHDAISKRELHLRFRAWLLTDEATIGPGGEYPKSPYIHVQDDGRMFELDPDTKRKAVDEYMGIVDELGDDLEWKVVANRRGRENAVAFGPNSVRLTNTLYLYLI